MRLFSSFKQNVTDISYMPINTTAPDTAITMTPLVPVYINKHDVSTIDLKDWCKVGRPKLTHIPVTDTKVDKQLSNLAKINCWRRTRQYFCEGYMCVGLFCSNSRSHEWHVTIDDLLESYTFCPWCGPTYRTLRAGSNNKVYMKNKND